MFALFAFGYLFGFVGLLLAVPVAAAIGVLARFALRKYLASRSTPASGAALSMPDPGSHRKHRVREPEPTQLALALDHAESHARARISWRGRPMPPRWR